MLTPEEKVRIVIRIDENPDTPNWTSVYGKGSKQLTALFKTDDTSVATALMRQIGVLDVAAFKPWNFSPDISGFGVGLAGVLLSDGSINFGDRGPETKKILLGLSSEGLITDEKVLQAIAALA
jgi:hypothetical protein